MSCPNDSPESLAALFQDEDRPRALVMEILDRIIEWAPKELRDIPALIYRIRAGDNQPLLEFPLIDIAAAAHTIWEDGYNVGREIDHREKGGD